MRRQRSLRFHGRGNFVSRIMQTDDDHAIFSEKNLAARGCFADAGRLGLKAYVPIAGDLFSALPYFFTIRFTLMPLITQSMTRCWPLRARENSRTGTDTTSFGTNPTSMIQTLTRPLNRDMIGFVREAKWLKNHDFVTILFSCVIISRI